MQGRPKTNEEARELAQQWSTRWAATAGPTNFDHPIAATAKCSSVTLETDTSRASATWMFVVPKDQYINNPTARTIHGGAIAMMFDNLTSLTMGLVRQPWEHTGVTRNLNVTYHRPAVEGEAVVLWSEVVGIGRRLATIRGELKRESDGKVLAMCVHEKANPDGHDGFKL